MSNFVLYDISILHQRSCNVMSSGRHHLLYLANATSPLDFESACNSRKPVLIILLYLMSASGVKLTCRAAGQQCCCCALQHLHYMLQHR
jgi:hypothetical protein